MSAVRSYQTNAQRQAAYRRRSEQARAKQLEARGLPALPAVPTIPGYRRWNAAMRHAAALLNVVSCEMQGYYQERSERWQESERGEEFEEMRQEVQETAERIQDLIDRE